MSPQQTSLDAYFAVSPDLGALQMAVYECIRKMRLATNRMISAYTRIPINVVTPRTGELRKMGLIQGASIDFCQESIRAGKPKKAIYWKVRA